MGGSSGPDQYLVALGVRCGDAERHRPKNGAIINQRTGPLSDHVHTGSCNCSGQNDVTGLPPDPEKPLPELVSPHQTAIGVFSRGLKRLVLAEELLSTRAYAALIIIGQKPNSHRYQYKYKSGLPRLSGFISSRYWLLTSGRDYLPGFGDYGSTKKKGGIQCRSQTPTAVTSTMQTSLVKPRPFYISYNASRI